MTTEVPKKRLDNIHQNYSQPQSPDAGVDSLDESTDTFGNISEVLSENREQNGDGSTKGDDQSKSQFKGKAKSRTVNDIKAELLKNMPTEKVMIRQIEKEIQKEIKYLHKKALKMTRTPGSINYFELANLMKKMRELKEILSVLVKSSYDALKSLWLRFVHGIM